MTTRKSITNELCSDGTVRELLLPGTRIRHKKHPDITGHIKCWEYHESGRVSPIPYNVEWDDNDRARQVIGGFWIYATDQCVEEWSQE